MLRVGDKLYGFCGGAFGRDSHDDKRVEAIGSDWVVARAIDSYGDCWAEFYSGCPEDLERYKEPINENN